MEPQMALDAPRFSVFGVDSAEGPSTVRESRSAELMPTVWLPSHCVQQDVYLCLERSALKQCDAIKHLLITTSASSAAGLQLVGCSAGTITFKSSMLVLRSVLLEEGFSAEAAKGLEERGHAVQSKLGGHARAVFGRGQIIRRNAQTGVLWGGSDPRADGQVLGW